MGTAFAFTAVVLSFSLIAVGQTTITGRLLGSNGEPMVKAHVHLLKLGDSKALASVEADRSGGYKISSDHNGPFLVEYTGVDHLSESVLLFTEKPLQERIDVRLATHRYPAEIVSVKIIGDFNDFDFGKAQEMTKQPDGTFVAEFETKAEKFRYQVLGIAGSRSVNGTQSDDFEFDGGGDYRSAVTPKKGKVRIVFDPNLLPRSKAQASVKFANPLASIAKAAEVLGHYCNGAWSPSRLWHSIDRPGRI